MEKEFPHCGAIVEFVGIPQLTHSFNKVWNTLIFSSVLQEISTYSYCSYPNYTPSSYRIRYYQHLHEKLPRCPCSEWTCIWSFIAATLNPDGFGNIFFGLGRFHLEKIIIAYIGKFLEESGAESVFVENEIFGLWVVKTVMNGGHLLARGKRGMRLISEALHRLQLIEFIKVIDSSQFQGLLENIAELQRLFEKEMLHQWKIQRKWREGKEKMSDFTEVFDKYKEEGKLKSEQFQYWNKFLEEIPIPILRDLTRLHREENWKLYLSAVCRSLSLFFAFDGTNYCRWVLLFYEDCIALEKNFPAIYASFLQGGFVVRQTLNYRSGVLMDQALEKEYNKPAKGQGGITGVHAEKRQFLSGIS